MSNTMSNFKKIVVFDLDETLGSFSEIAMFWNTLNNVVGHLNENDFYNLMDIFNDFQRPKIIKILKYLRDRKKDGSCFKVMIYTNNNGPKKWAKMISNYFDKKVGTKLFDQIIAAFMVNGKKVEINRTSHNKTLCDFFNCTQLPEDTEICFLDDQYYPGMKSDKVYYINIKPYTFSMSYKNMIEKYYRNCHPNMDENIFSQLMMIELNKFKYTHYEKSIDEKNIDYVISKKIILYLDEFFKHSKRYTLKHKILSNKGTRKHRKHRKS